MLMCMYHNQYANLNTFIEHQNTFEIFVIESL